jgi:hypothetical protein
VTSLEVVPESLIVTILTILWARKSAFALSIVTVALGIFILGERGRRDRFGLDGEKVVSPERASVMTIGCG